MSTEILSVQYAHKHELEALGEEHGTGTRIDNPIMASSVYMDSKLLKSLRGLQRHQDSSRSIAECREVSGL